MIKHLLITLYLALIVTLTPSQAITLLLVPCAFAIMWLVYTYKHTGLSLVDYMPLSNKRIASLGARSEGQNYNIVSNLRH